MGSVSAFNKMSREKAEKKGGRVVEQIDIQPAEGGWTCNVRYKPEEKKEKAKGDACCGSMWEPTKPSVFTDKAKMLAYLGTLL